jgi:hypothetical protein
MKQGRLTISRVTSNVEDTYIAIALRGDGSPLPVVEIKLTPEQFGNAITGLGYVSCEWSEPRKDRATAPHPDEVKQ